MRLSFCGSSENLLGLLLLGRKSRDRRIRQRECDYLSQLEVDMAAVCFELSIRRKEREGGMYV